MYKSGSIIKKMEGSRDRGTTEISALGVATKQSEAAHQNKIAKGESCVSNDGAVPWRQRRLVPQQEAFSEISPMTRIGLKRQKHQGLAWTLLRMWKSKC